MNSKTLFSLSISFTLLLLIALGCRELNKNSNTNSENINKTITPQNSPTKTIYESGGLGVDFEFWEKEHGKGNPDDPKSPSYYSYEDGKFVIQFSEGTKGKVQYIEHPWGDKNAVTIDVARNESKKLIPKDAKFLKSYKSQSGSTVDLYHSDSLKTQFSEDNFIGGKPGDFIILYRNQTGKTTTFIIALGNNP